MTSASVALPRSERVGLQCSLLREHGHVTTARGWHVSFKVYLTMRTTHERTNNRPLLRCYGARLRINLSAAESQANPIGPSPATPATQTRPARRRPMQPTGRRARR